MKIIEIKAQDFFELLKLKEASMWDIFSQMIDGEEKKLVFLDQQHQVLFQYILPKTIEQLREDKTIFAEAFIKKMN